MPKSDIGNVSEPTTSSWLPLTWVCRGIVTDLVTPWIVMSPVACTVTGEPDRASAGMATGWVSLNVAVGYVEVSSPLCVI